MDQVPQAELALEPRNRQAHNPVAGLWHLLHLHSALGAHEENLGLGIQLLELAGNGDGREDVPSRSAAADNHS